MDNYTIKQYYKTGAIALLNAEEKNNNLVLKKRKKKFFEGKYNYINCDTLISNSYFPCSYDINTNIIRLNQNQEFAHYFVIYSPESDNENNYFM